ncbi:uncharacterized protein ColSpa_06405 [Colletotrichum spaethianum]|uniref:Uncharacterized protein n=1 Tax=Colletotrichum spaethianum TaxID=700344 RepID=A0AA37LF16_9PEZI|nr:uncharacterized protein ColSpa_06405 [Colletotrichum spaethianum]GKT46224.1 hypothetical protein ColSpa_06405 [Colletotrichum spaethianum]
MESRTRDETESSEQILWHQCWRESASTWGVRVYEEEQRQKMGKISQIRFEGGLHVATQSRQQET